MSDICKKIEEEIPRLRRYARALTRDINAADDLVQDCLTRALSKVHLWQEGTDLRAWLFTILHNVHVDRLAARRRAGTQVELDKVVTYLSHPAPQPAALELRDLQRGLTRLPDEQREVVLLIGLEGMSYQEAAEVLQVPVGTVMSRLSRGREALRRSMDGERRPAPLRRQAGAPPSSLHQERRPAAIH